MKFYSTKNKDSRVSFTKALMQGMPDDKGLYMPETIPDHSSLIDGIENLNFQDISFVLANSFLKDDFKNAEIEDIIDKSITFDTPVVNIKDNLSIVELFHGPTLAFKDFGARFMARTMEKVVTLNDRELNILVATSGDTGSAVANGFYNVEGINVIILYPSNKVSNIQEKQLTTLDKNIFALEIGGTFDDCQKLVKEAFLDKNLQGKINLSSANSINVARLIPQSFYYFNAYAKLKNKKSVIISVPSGNFGNLTAGILAKHMGLPIDKFIASTNINDTVSKFLTSGKYIPQISVSTISNAMDVGNPSNINRIIDLYDDINSLKNDIKCWSFSDEETINIIVNILSDNDYLLDPHSAIGLLGLKKYSDKNKNVEGLFLGTAHPAKFSDIIESNINKIINIPNRLQEVIDKEKKSIFLNNDYNEFSDYLLSNFK